MTTIQLPLDEETLERARAAVSMQDNTLEGMITDMIETLAAQKPNPILGIFREDAALLDEITEDAYRTRERDPLRLADEEMPD